MEINLNINEVVNGPKLIKNIQVSDGLSYHLRNNKPIIECVYKIGSNSFNTFMEELKSLHNDGSILLCEKDLKFIYNDEN